MARARIPGTRGLTKVYRTGEVEVQAVRGVDLDLFTGELVVLRRALPDGTARCVAVRAPVTGRVLRVVTQSEGVVATGTPIAEIGNVRDLETLVQFLSTEAVRVSEGAPVRIEQWGGGTVVLAGRVRHIEPYSFTKVSALGVAEQRVNVIIDFTDDHECWAALGHGYCVEVRIVVSEAVTR